MAVLKSEVLLVVHSLKAPVLCTQILAFASANFHGASFTINNYQYYPPLLPIEQRGQCLTLQLLSAYALLIRPFT